MKKILSVLVFTLLNVHLMYSQSQIRFTVQLAPGSEGRGQVSASASSTTPGTYSTSFSYNKGDATRCTDIVIKHWHGTASKPGYIYAKSTDDTKYYFEGWSTDGSTISIGPSNNPYGPIGEAKYYCEKVSYTGPSTYYAHFGEIVSKSMVLQPVNSNYTGCTYTASYKLNNTPYTPTITTDPASKVQLDNITDATAFTFALTANAAGNFRFYRWRIDYEDGTYEYRNDAKMEFTFPKSGAISCEFINKEYAQFILKGDKANVYSTLSSAIQAAQVEAVGSDKRVIVVKESGTLYTETESVDGIYDASTKTYTIPKDITLLVPGDDNHTVRKGNVVDEDFDTSERHNLYRKLTIPSGITLQFDGNLCVYAKLFLTGAHNYCAMPLDYGQIHLNDGAQIILNDGAVANIHGYITGNIDDETKVLAKKGSHVYEIMQVRDYRGGQGSVAGLSTDVFLFNHYFVQNIETTLELEWGAYAYVSSGFDLEGTVYATAVFIAPREGNKTPDQNEESAFLYMGEGSVMKKYLDRTTDRQCYELTSEVESESLMDKVYMNLSGYEVNSSKFVLPITTNMNLTFSGKARVIVSYDVAMLAGAKVTIGREAVVTLKKNLFVYDEDEVSVVYNGDNTKLTKGNKYSYFSDQNGGPLNYQLKKQSIAPSITWNDAWLTDATIDVNGTLQGAIYTTQGGAAIISSEGAGVVKLENLSNTKKTYQVVLYVNYEILGRNIYALENLEIPITSAKLQNGDDSYSAGNGEADNTLTYKYYPLAPNEGSAITGKWLAGISDGIELSNLVNNPISVQIPESKDFSVSFQADLSSSLSITDVDIKMESVPTQYSVDKSKISQDGNAYTIPIIYNPTRDNGYTCNENLIITFTCKNAQTGEQPVISKSIPLSAKQDYTPSFTINGSSEATIDLSFGARIDGSDEKFIKVVPTDGTVADRDYKEKDWYVTWTPTSSELSVESPFRVENGDYFEGDGVTVYYEPKSNIGAPHTKTITISAQYGDEEPIVKTINLIGTPELKSSTLLFNQEEVEIYPGDEIIEILAAGTGNSSTPVFKFNSNQDENKFIEYVLLSNGNYGLKVKSEVVILQPQVVYLSVSQTDDDKMSGGSDQLKITVKPLVQWNWSKLYFNNSYDTPIEVLKQSNNDDWSLEYIEGCSFMEFDEHVDPTKQYAVSIGSGEECSATFTFTRGDYSCDFSADIYSDPRYVPLCLMASSNPSRTFNDITIDCSKDNVSQPLVTQDASGVHFATTPSSGVRWDIEIKGVPDKLTITSQSAERWSVYQSTDGIFGNTPITPAADKSYQLEPQTRYIRIVCAPGEEGVITELCVTELEGVSTETEIVYLPIMMGTDGTQIQTSDSVLLSYVSVDADLTLSVEQGDGTKVASEVIALSNDKLSATNINELYKEVDITITNKLYQIEETIYLVVKNAENVTQLKLPIRLYKRPQSLPIYSRDWVGNNAEKYYFYMNKTRTQYVQYDEALQTLKFLPSGTDKRYVTFDFKGGPSYMSFETDIETTLDNWKNYWKIEAYNGSSYIQIDADPVIETIEEAGSIRYRLRWDLPYTAKEITLRNNFTVEEHVINNLEIDGEPDLDVQQGNNTIEHTSKENFTDKTVRDVVVTAINLEVLKVNSNNSNFVVKHGETIISKTPVAITSEALGAYTVGDITFQVSWAAENAVDEGLLTFTDASGNVLATIRLLGTTSYITLDNADETGLYTGFAESIKDNHPFVDFFKKSEKYKVKRHPVDLTNAFDQNGTALFDYLIVYGETTTTDGSTTVTAPTSANIVNGEATGKGSNAKTPYYIYRKATNTSYQFVFDSENANVSDKADIAQDGDIPHAKVQSETQYIQVEAGKPLSVYVTGFCPYATTGYKKEQEGVWFFRGEPTAKLDLYLEDCHIYSRNKTEIGCSAGKFDFDVTFQAEQPEKFGVARGSGGVFVFECNNEGELEVPVEKAFQVNIHTRDTNVLKSNFGTFYQVYGMRAYQVSSPIQVHMNSEVHVGTSRTHLTFDDLWPTATQPVRTNGFISLQKQENNAPSIDLGNPLTEVNFRGGQVELQNAQNVSDKYKTTLAISYRSGIMAAGGINVQMAYGIGTDDAQAGTVNFYDGTITVIPMKVKETEKKYYLMDPLIDANGDTVKVDGVVQESDWTSCLRCPKNTFVRGGSISMLRACMDVTSKGGAPTDGHEPLGRFIYKGDEYLYTYYNNGNNTPKETDSSEKWLVKPSKIFPSDPLYGTLTSYYNTKDYTYGLSSVTPDKNNNLTLWIPEGYANVKIEDDRYMYPWKACMTRIAADLGLPGLVGEVGGDVVIESDADISNLLYCHLDDYTHAVISAHTGSVENDDIKYQYYAPVKVPDNFKVDGFDLTGGYLDLQPSFVGEPAYEVRSDEDADYEIDNRVYYITNALADTWMNFTMPFDVENIYVVEACPEFQLEDYFESDEAQNYMDPEERDGWDGPYTATRLFQGKHNADFASFFGMAIALGSDAEFNEIKEDFLDWAYLQDKEDGYTGTREEYDWRGVYPLTHYDGSNFTTSHFYLYVNNGEWTTDESVSEFTTRWEIAPAKDPETKILLHKGENYSMLFPDHWGWDVDEVREYWDYWTGKYLIFESTQASQDDPHKIAGRNTTQNMFERNNISNDGNARLMGNNSFATFKDYPNESLFLYESRREGGVFVPLFDEDNQRYNTIYPTNTVLSTNMIDATQVKGVTREGKILYRNGGNGNGGVTTGGHTPTVGGGNSLFITSINGGINIAVAAPQYVRVITATGAVIFNGMIQTATDVALPNEGIYIVSGENEAHKIMY